MDPLRVNGKESRTIRLTVAPGADFREVIRTLESISIPQSRVSVEHLRFAILELLNNSIRAHREHGEPRDISIDLSVLDSKLVVRIRDFGGGFDTSRLPYDINEDPSRLDLHSSPFAEYQKQNNYKRFGMGIFVAKKTFDEFHLAFLDEMDRPSPWVQGRTIGTLITLAVKVEHDGSGGRETAHGK
jgi:anti-sigma regulatory factor (Ser/Thr protein kinase)